MLEIVLTADRQGVSAHCRRDGLSSKPRMIGTFAAVESFTRRVGAAVRAGAEFDEALLAQAHALYEALFCDELLSAYASVTTNESSLIRLVIEDSRLQMVPWEALCKPGTSRDFLAMGSRSSVARGIASISAPTRKIENALRLLVIAPQDHEAGLQALRIALSEPIELGAVEWLEPIRGERATIFRIFDRLRTGTPPHAIHFIGHGSIDWAGHPALRIAPQALDVDLARMETLAQTARGSSNEHPGGPARSAEKESGVLGGVPSASHGGLEILRHLEGWGRGEDEVAG